MGRVLKSKVFWSSVGKRFLVAFGFLWLLLEPAGLFLKDSIPGGWETYFGLIIFSMIIATIAAYPRSVSATIPGSNVSVTVCVGDLFDATDNVIIGTNDVFDTQIGDDIIHFQSIQGQFVMKRFDGSVPALDEAIDKQLAGVPYTTDETKVKGKKDRYEVGLCVEIVAKGVRHYLSAYCRMGANLKTDSDFRTLINALEEIWSKVRNSGQNQGVSMAVLGSDFARIELTQTQLVQILVISFVNASKVKHVAPSLTIYVHPSNIDKVSFSALKQWLDSVLWA